MANKVHTFDREPAEGPRTTPPPGRTQGTPQVEREEQDGRASRGTTSEEGSTPTGGEDVAYTPTRDENRPDKSAQNEHRPRRTSM